MPTIIIKETLQKDLEYPVLTDLTDVESSVSAQVLDEVSGPTATSYSDIIYNMTKTLYVTNINSCEFGFVPFNDTITYEE